MDAQQAPPQDQQTQPQQQASLSSYGGGAQQTTAPASSPKDTGYIPGTNAPVDALMGVGNAIGGAIEAVGGKDARENLSGLALPVQEVAEAKGIGDKIGALTSYWTRPAEHQEGVSAEKAVNAEDQKEPYNLLDPADLGRAAGDVGGKLAEYAQHPEDFPRDIVESIPADSSSTAVFTKDGLGPLGDLGDAVGVLDDAPGLEEWVKNNPDTVSARGDDYQGLYQDYLTDIGYTWESGGLGGAVKGIFQESLQDPTLIPSIVLTGGATKAADIAASSGKVGLAHGIMEAEGLAQKAIGGPEQILIESAPGIVKRAAGKVVPSGVQKVFDYTPTAQREEQTAVINEIAQRAAIERRAANEVGTAPTGAAPQGAAPIPPVQHAVPPAANPYTPPAPAVHAGVAPPAGGRVASRQWEIRQDGLSYVDGARPTPGDLKAAEREWWSVPPKTLKGFDDAHLATGQADSLTVMRAALTQGMLDTKGVKVPWLADDVPKSRMMGDPHITPAQKAAGGRYIAGLTHRINTFGQDEVEYQLRLLAESKYRGKRGSVQPIEITYDNQRRALADALKASKYDGPVNLGPHFQKKNGMWTPTGKVIMANPNGVGPVLNLADFEPDLARFQQLMGQPHGPIRVTTWTPPGNTPTPPPVTPPPPPVAPTGALIPPVPPAKAHASYDNLMVPSTHIPYLDMPVKGGTLFTTVTSVQDELHRMMDLLHGVSPPARATELDELLGKYSKIWKDLYRTDPDWTKLSERDVDLFSGTAATKIWHDTLPKIQQKNVPLISGASQAVRHVNDFRSSVGLYSYTKAPRQVLNQYSGNFFSAVLTKPQAITGLLNPRLAADLYRQAKEMRLANSPNQRYKSALARSRERMGRAPNTSITDPTKALAFTGSKGMPPGMTALRKLVAPDWLRDIVSIPDGMWRDSISAVHHAPRIREMQQQFVKDAPGLTEKWNKAGGYAAQGLPATKVSKVIADTIDSKFSREMRYAEVRATDITEALKTAFPNATAEQQRIITKLGREYATRDNTVDQLVGQEANRLAYKWVPTNADEALRHVFLYHYWSSRSGGRYIAELAKNPWMMANVVRLSQAMNEEADTLAYPDWMRGFMRIFGSPAGSTLFMDPRNLIATVGMFADWQYGMDPDKLGQDVTDLGRARGISPFFFSPLLDSLAWGFGFYGNDAKAPMDPTGLEAIPKLAIQVINLANANGQLPPGMLRDATNNPVVLPEAPLAYFTAKLASVLGGIVRTDPQPIPNLFQSQEAARSAYLYQILIEDHPDWNEDQITRAAHAMEVSVEAGNAASPEWLAAERMRAGNQLQGPEMDFLPEPFRSLVGGAIRQLSPLQILDRPEILMEARKTKPVVAPLGREPIDLPDFGDAYDKSDLMSGIYDTTRMTGLNIANEDAYGTDPNLKAAKDKYDAIVAAENPNGETVQGVHYSQEQIKAMTDARRYRLAREAMGEMGVTQDDVNAQYELSDALITSNPDLAAYRGWQAKLKSAGSEQERNAIIDGLYQTEPAFKRAMDHVGYEKGSPDWYKAASWPETFMAASGERTSVYDPESVPTGMDTSALGQEAIDTVENRDTGFVGTVERSVNEYQLAQDLLDAEYPDYGYAVGAGNLPSDVWKHMKTVWEDNDIDTSYITKTNHYGAQYAAWLTANPDASDTSIQAYLDATMEDDGSNKFADQGTTEDAAAAEVAPPIDLNGPMNRDWFVKRGVIPNTSAAAQSAAPIVYNDRELYLRSAPNGGPITLLTPKVPLRMIEQQGAWAHVTVPGGFDGWVPTSMLLTG